jgi:hypothetical protein
MYAVYKVTHSFVIPVAGAKQATAAGVLPPSATGIFCRLVRCPMLYCTVLRSSHLDTLVLAMLYQDQTCIVDFDSLRHVPLLFTIAVIGTFSRKAISDERSVSFGYSDNKTRARVTINMSSDLFISCTAIFTRSSYLAIWRVYSTTFHRPLHLSTTYHKPCPSAMNDRLSASTATFPCGCCVAADYLIGQYPDCDTQN